MGAFGIDRVPERSTPPRRFQCESRFDLDACWERRINFYYGIVSTDKRDGRYIARLVHEATRSPVSASVDREARAKDRFIPSADGTEITDTMTGLIWRRCAAGMTWNADAQTCGGAPAGFHWTAALDYAKAHREGGWRLPNVKELFSIADHERVSPAIDDLAFPNTPTDKPFLSSPVHFYTGRVLVQVVSYSRGIVYKDFVNDFPLRLVRRGRE
jgi:hypothetical protein